MEEETCPDCKGKLSYKQDEIYCTKCGLVVDDSPVDFGRDDYDNNESRNKQNRTGAPITYLSPWIWTKIPYLKSKGL